MEQKSHNTSQDNERLHPITVGWIQVSLFPFQTRWRDVLWGGGRSCASWLPLTLKQENNYPDFSNYLRGRDRWILEVAFTFSPQQAFFSTWHFCCAIAAPWGHLTPRSHCLRQPEWALRARFSLCFTPAQLKVYEGGWLLSSAMGSCCRINLFLHSYWITQGRFCLAKALRDLLVAVAVFPLHKISLLLSSHLQEKSF